MSEVEKGQINNNNHIQDCTSAMFFKNFKRSFDNVLIFVHNAEKKIIYELSWNTIIS